VVRRASTSIGCGNSASRAISATVHKNAQPTTRRLIQGNVDLRTLLRFCRATGTTCRTNPVSMVCALSAKAEAALLVTSGWIPKWAANVFISHELPPAAGTLTAARLIPLECSAAERLAPAARTIGPIRDRA